MKKTLGSILAGITVLILQSASATLLFQESFNYASGNALGPTPPWTGGSGLNLQIGSANLSYPGLAEVYPPGNNMVLTSGASVSATRNFVDSPVTSGSVYYSFLVQCTTLPTANNYMTALNLSGNPNGSTDMLSIYAGATSGGWRIGVRHAGVGSGATYATSGGSTIALGLGTTYLMVAKYTFGPGTADDTVSLFVNPLPGQAEPGSPNASVTGGTDAAGLQVVGFKAQTATTQGNFIFDTLRIGTSWEAVTIPEPSVATLGLLAGLLAVLRRFGRA